MNENLGGVMDERGPDEGGCAATAGHGPAEVYEISTDPGRLDLPRVHGWLSGDSYWAAGRTMEAMRSAEAHSLNFGGYETATGEQRGYARVITDHTTFAWLCDVYVDPAARGRGLGTRLAVAVRDHLAPLGLRRILLATRDAHGVYAKVGFAPLADPESWMALVLKP
jgi:GNAT superfamily N-acetyltransferase